MLRKALVWFNSCASLAVCPRGIPILKGTVQCQFVWYWRTTLEIFFVCQGLKWINTCSFLVSRMCQNKAILHPAVLLKWLNQILSNLTGFLGRRCRVCLNWITMNSVLMPNQQAQCILQPSLQHLTSVCSDKVPYFQILPYSDILRYCIASDILRYCKAF